MIFLPVILGKISDFVSRLFGIGHGGTWPGEIALSLNPDIFSHFCNQLNDGIIIVAGTNGKTTTTSLIKHTLLKTSQKRISIIHNDSGANLLNGLVSAFIKQASVTGKISKDWMVAEVDENTLPHVISQTKNPNSKDKKIVIVLLNLFRDQLDRYGEVDVIAEKWAKALKDLPGNTKLILNADDPLIAHLGMSLRAEGEAISDLVRDRHAEFTLSSSNVLAMTKVVYFGLNDPKLFQKKMEHATDSIFCLNCGSRLKYKGIYYSHTGIWECMKCGERRPKPDVSKWQSRLPGVYNRYNTLASVAVAKTLGLSNETIKKGLSFFSPAFGRQEEFDKNGKKIKIFLSKNPTGFNESLRTVIALGAKEILFVLNDRIPDGRDVSWIWDVDTEEFLDNSMKIIVSGDRAYDMGLRIKYSNSSKFQISNFKFQIKEDLKEALTLCITQTPKSETLYILATYSAMLEVRKILKGRKIL